MDFFNMDFSMLFYEKHGKEVFTTIKNQILKEDSIRCNKEYIEIIFKIALLDFLGFDDEKIMKIIWEITKNEAINIDKMKLKHTKSIYLIQKYLKDNIKEITNKNTFDP